MNITKKYKVWFSISIITILIGVALFFYRGINIGIDFVGGTTVLIDIGKEFDKLEVDEILKKYSQNAVSKKVNGTQIEYSLEDSALLSQTEISGSIGKELTIRALIALLIATIVMLVYIIIRFEIYFGIAAVVALIHDVLITLSAYSIFMVPINSPFMLTLYVGL